VSRRRLALHQSIAILNHGQVSLSIDEQTAGLRGTLFFGQLLAEDAPPKLDGGMFGSARPGVGRSSDGFIVALLPLLA
jgi:hypothetical protein